MERGRKESLRRKLGNSNPVVMNDISQQLIELKQEFPADLLNLYIQNIKNGIHPDKDILLKTVTSIKNKDLYVAAKPLINSIWDKIELLKASIPDSEIELILTESLVNCYTVDPIVRKK